MYKRQDLKPERGREVELGFDGAFLNERVSAELTFYRRNTSDGILSQDVAPSSGFAGQRFINIGGIQSQGVELATRLNAYSSNNLNVDFGFNISKNDNQVTDLGDLPLAVDQNGQKYIQVGAQRHIVGKPVASYYDLRVVKADFDATTKRAINMICDDGKGGTGACLTSVSYTHLTLPTRDLV